MSKEVSSVCKYHMGVLCPIPVSTTENQFPSPSLIPLHLSIIISPRGHHYCSLFGPSASILSILDTADRLAFEKPTLNLLLFCPASFPDSPLPTAIFLKPLYLKGHRAMSQDIHDMSPWSGKGFGRNEVTRLARK